MNRQITLDDVEARAKAAVYKSISGSFKSDALTALGLDKHPLADKIFDTAREMGGTFGNYETWLCLQTLERLFNADHPAKTVEELFEQLPHSIAVPPELMVSIMAYTKFVNDSFPEFTRAALYVRRVQTTKYGWLFHAGYSDGIYLGHRTNSVDATLSGALQKLASKLQELGIGEDFHRWLDQRKHETFLTERNG